MNRNLTEEFICSMRSFPTQSFQRTFTQVCRVLLDILFYVMIAYQWSSLLRKTSYCIEHWFDQWHH